jgi:aldehyde dehydrogenase (NAD(P)+)
MGYLAVVYGGSEEGSYLVNHPAVDEVHITGSDKTHDLLVWGAPGAERDARKRRGEPLLQKEITSELGNISPVIIVPGPYRQDELWFQARDVAGMVCNNASFNCNSAKLLVTARHWNQRGSFLELVQKGLAQGSVRKAYYPGAEARWAQFTAGRKNVRTIGTAGAGELPYALISDVDPSRGEDPIFNQEPWCTILSETALAKEDPVSFLEEAVGFLNERVWGTLNATLIVHPQSLRDPKISAAVEKAIRDLRYGTVALNSWPAAVFALGSPPWGGHPSDSLGDIQSGRGSVHNTLMLEDVEKCVLRAPLKGFPIGLWFPGHRSLPQLVRRLVDFEMAPSWLKVPAIAFAALRA